MNKRKPSEWNTFVKDNFKETQNEIKSRNKNKNKDKDENITIGNIVSELSKKYRLSHKVNEINYTNCRGLSKINCDQTLDCKYVVPKKKLKSGLTRHPFCFKNTIFKGKQTLSTPTYSPPSVPQYEIPWNEEQILKKIKSQKLSTPTYSPPSVPQYEIPWNEEQILKKINTRKLSMLTPKSTPKTT